MKGLETDMQAVFRRFTQPTLKDFKDAAVLLKILESTYESPSTKNQLQTELIDIFNQRGIFLKVLDVKEALMPATQMLFQKRVREENKKN